MKKSVMVIFFTFLLIILFYLPAHSAEEPQETTNRQRVEDETLAALKKTESVEVKEEKIAFDYGGLISSYYWAYINDDNSKDTDDLLRNITYQNLYLWVKSTVLQKHLIYLRIKNTYITRHDVSSEYTGEGDDYTGPVLDMGYANISLKEGCRLFLGRQYLTLGKGITYNKTHDGIQLKAYTDRFMFKTFFSRTKPHEDNLDYSIPGYDKYGHKNFYGLELAYIESLRIVPYFYFLLQDDRPKEEPEDAIQEYGYNSHYFGIGVSGETPTDLTNLDWWLEIIKEQGKVIPMPLVST